MRKGKLSKGIALLLASAMVMTGLSACGKDPVAEETTTAAAGETTAAAGSEAATTAADTEAGKETTFTSVSYTHLAGGK